MQYGFVKVCAATVPIKVADVEFNKEQIINSLKVSAEEGSQITVFPELGICGYTCGDLFNQRALLDAVDKAVGEICNASKGIKTLFFIGAPLIYNSKLYNCAVAISDGNILGVIPKTFIPNYGEFYEQRHFTTAPAETHEITVAGKNVAFGTKIIFKASNFPELTVSAEICEDLWAPDSPSISHAKSGANIIVNLSCSDETVGKADFRRDLVRVHSAKLVSGYIYATAGDGESTTDMVFAGHNIICEKGNILAESRLFENGLLYSEIDVDLLSNERRRKSSVFFAKNDSSNYKVIEFTANEFKGGLSRSFPQKPFVPNEVDKIKERTELILSIQANGLIKRLLHTRSKTAVIGISGGLDSALALLVTHRAFNIIGKDSKDIIAVTMPGFGTTGRTKNNSLRLMEALDVTEKTITIERSVTQHFNDIGHKSDTYDVTYENAQARMRTLILMDIANQTGGMVIGTGDLSELALGWATYNGDHMSMYGVNCSVPKTLVKYIVKSEADRLGGACKDILYDILATEISPELLPPKDGGISQKTEDLVGPYVLHDFFLYYVVRYGFMPEKIQFIAEKTFNGTYDKAEINKWLKNFYKRFFAQQFKRSCIPDGVKVGSVALSPRGDWRMPSDAVADVWLKDI